MAGYDSKKAEVFNKLRQQGLSEDAAMAQAGITDAEANNYAIGSNGQLGAMVVGGGKVAGVDYQNYTAAELRDQAKFDQGLQSVDYPEKADAPVSTKTPMNYTTTSTEQVSGGGSTTVTAGARQNTAASQALQPSIDAKQAEIDQFNANNPSNFARKKQGLPPLTPEENLQRQQQLDTLTKEKSALVNQQNDAKTPGEPTVTTVPNTTTNTATTTYSTTAVDSNVQTPGGNDPAINQQTDLQQAQSNVPVGSINDAPTPVRESGIAAANEAAGVSIAEPQQVPVEQSLAPREEIVPTDAPAEVVIDEPQNQPLLTPEQSIAQAQTVPAAQDPAAAAADFNANTNASVQEAIGVQAPAPVDPAQNPGAASPFGGGAANDAAARNPEAIEQNLAAANEAATKQRLKEQQAIQAQFQAPADGDWRVRLKLAPSATYLYMDDSNKLLAPLKASNGVVFPYMPSIQTSYNADYSETALTHSNYKGYFYNSSHVGDIQINGVFTAQDTREANYLLAVIHFFRSVTKMFYGQDAQRGAPPPLVYLQGLGEYQFNNHPCVIKSFSYNLPNDVDYIRTKPNNYNINLNNRLVKSQNAPANSIASVVNRLKNALLPKGALPNLGAQELTIEQSVTNVANDTYVPTKIEIQLSLLPIQTRSQQSQQFSVREFSNGNLLKGGFW